MNALFLLQGMGMMAVGILAVLYWKKLSRVSATLFLWGGLSFLTAMVIKSAAATLIPEITTRLRAFAPDYISEPLLWLLVGLLTGVCECGISLAFVYWLRRIRSASWSEAIGYGLGFGATEAVLLGIFSFVIVLLIITIPEQLPPEVVDLMDTGNVSILAIPVPIVERAITIVLHAFSSILIVYAVQNNAWKWFWISFMYKTAMDIIAGYIQITYGVQNLTLSGVWLVELAIIPFAIIGIWGMLRIRNNWLSSAGASARSTKRGFLTMQSEG
jgi:uncharacterized membrane protein YhfC